MPIDPNRVQAVFLAAVRQTVGSRALVLERECGCDDELRQRVETLLQAHDEPGSFLESRPAGVLATVDMPAERPIGEKLGTQIGPYKLLQQIGEGGMGTVYMAEQTQPVQRKVALKVIKAGMDSQQVIARFEAERQALAMMDHVNIARVLDAGATESGLPYFVMELVHGVSIIKYCDDNHLTPRQRLELFVPVCQAIQHAHQKGIIHRDIKPSNVMITLYDGKAVPKVIDFGVAKATEQRLTERTLFTQYGTMVGTLEYTSPEQAEMSALGVDTRSDIFSLGVLLYELLTGSTPLSHQRVKEAAYGEVLRMIRDEEPPKPSTRLSDSGAALASISANRHMEPAKLTKLVRGELDWIVMKTLEKDRNRRYDTANGFAADVQRYLNDETVQACPPSAIYRFRKFARRNKAAISFAGIVVSLLVAAVVILTDSNARIRRESQAKAGALKEKNAALVTARQAVDQMLLRVADEKLNDVAFANPLRQALLEDAIRFYEGLMVQAETDTGLRDDMLRVLKAMCTVHRELGRYDDARQSFERYIHLLDQMVEENPNELKYRFDRAYAEESLAYLLEITPSLPNEQLIEDHYRKAIELFTVIERGWPDDAQPMIMPLRHLAELANKRGDHFQAERLWREAIESGETFFLKRVEHAADVSLTSIKRDTAMLGRLDVAEPQLRSQLCWASVCLGSLLTTTNRLSEAESVLQNGLRHADILLKKEPRRNQARDVAASLNHRLAAVYVRMGRVHEAILLFHRAVNEIESLCAEFPLTAGYWQTARYFHEQMVNTLQGAGRDDEARESVRRMYNWIQRTAPHVPDETEALNELLLTQKQLVDLLRSTGQEREAEQVTRTADEQQTKLDKEDISTRKERADSP